MDQGNGALNSLFIEMIRPRQSRWIAGAKRYSYLLHWNEEGFLVVLTAVAGLGVQKNEAAVYLVFVQVGTCAGNIVGYPDDDRI